MAFLGGGRFLLSAGLYCGFRKRSGKVFAYVGLPQNLKDLKRGTPVAFRRGVVGLILESSLGERSRQVLQGYLTHKKLPTLGSYSKNMPGPYGGPKGGGCFLSARCPCSVAWALKYTSLRLGFRVYTGVPRS
jgi:hypothetical protein